MQCMAGNTTMIDSAFKNAMSIGDCTNLVYITRHHLPLGEVNSLQGPVLFISIA